MPDTVKLPILGPVNKGTAAGIAIGGITLAGYMIYRQSKKSKAAAAAASAAASAASGYGYGASGYGYGSQLPSPYDGYGYGATGASGGFPAGYYGYGVAEPQAFANTTNAQWTQAAIAQLTGEGYDAQTLSAALGAYTEGQQVTTAQDPMIQAAIGVEGYPPVPGANGYPPSINVQGTGGGGTGGGQGTGGATVKVPAVEGNRVETANAKLKKAGLVSHLSGPRTGGTAYYVNSQTPGAGTMVASGSTVDLGISTKKG
jgi:PASTA domain